MKIADDIRIETDERTFVLEIDGPDGVTERFSLNQEAGERLYDAARREIGPWIHERDAALTLYRAAAEALTPDADGGYDLDDPKHPTFVDRLT